MGQQGSHDGGVSTPEQKMKPGDSIVQSAKYLNMSATADLDYLRRSRRGISAIGSTEALFDLIEGNQADDRQLP